MSNSRLRYKQIALEMDNINNREEKSIQALLEMLRVGKGSETQVGQLLLKFMFRDVVELFDEYFANETLTGWTKRRRDFTKLITEDTKLWAHIVLVELMNGTLKSLSRKTDQGIYLAAVISKITNNMLRQQKMFKLKEDEPRLLKYFEYEYKRAGQDKRSKLIKDNIDHLYEDEHKELRKDALKAVSQMVNMYLEKQDTFLIVKNSQKAQGVQKAYKAVRLNPKYVDDIIDNINVSVMTLPPMISPPAPWTGYTSGGFEVLEKSFVRHHSSLFHNKMRNYEDEIAKVMSIVNDIQATEWRVNSRILDVVNAIEKEQLLDKTKPRLYPKLIGGLEARELVDPDVEFKWKEGIEGKKYGELIRKRESLDLENGISISKRIRQKGVISIANEYSKYKAIYFPHNVDYRNRIYPMTTFLHPQGTALEKSLLEFSKGEIVKGIGVKWLKIQLANMQGLDKESEEQREFWVDDNEELISKIAKDWRKHIYDWIDADSPLEFLAACFAWDDYRNGREVHLPVFLDMSCSGIAIYSGMLRDRKGAIATNVITSPSGEMEDIYTEVARETDLGLKEGRYHTTEEIKLSKGRKKFISTHKVAESFRGRVGRKMVKMNTMTVPYNVSNQGRIDQNAKWIEEEVRNDNIFWQNIPGERTQWVPNKVITSAIHYGIKRTVKGAIIGQDWINKVVRNTESNLLWKTPIYNFPVFQANYKYDEERVNTALAKFVIRLGVIKGAYNKVEAKNSTAPNVVHSVDATILLRMVEIIKKMNKKMSVGVIHDAYGVLPNNVPAMRIAFKRAYVEVMQADPLQKWFDDIESSIKKEKREELSDIPYINDLDIDEVISSKYIIS